MVQSILTRTGLTRFAALTLLLLSLTLGVLASPAKPASAHVGTPGTLCGSVDAGLAIYMWQYDVWSPPHQMWAHYHTWLLPDGGSGQLYDNFCGFLS